MVDQKDGKGIKDVEIKLENIDLGVPVPLPTLKTDENGKAITPDFINVGTKLTLLISKIGFNGIDVPNEIIVSDLTSKNMIMLKKVIKEVTTKTYNLNTNCY